MQISITRIPGNMSTGIQVNDGPITRIVYPPGTKDTVILSIDGIEVDRKQFAPGETVTIGYGNGTAWLYRYEDKFVRDNLVYFFQAVSAYAVKELDVFKIQTWREIIDFWNAMEWLENWQQENEYTEE